MDHAVELLRLQGQVDQDELPGGIGWVDFQIECPGNAVEVLEMVRQLLIVVLTNANTEEFLDDEDAPDLDIEHWLSLLPQWFLTQTPVRIVAADHDPASIPYEEKLSHQPVWGLTSWLFWFTSPYADRFWRWWHAEAISSDLIRLRVEVDELVFPWDALRWAFLAAGAQKMLRT